MVKFSSAIDCNNKIIGVMAQIECNANSHFHDWIQSHT